MKELQARYANNPEAANQAVQQLYQTENVNPLAGCLPAIAQIPIFISLYRCGRWYGQIAEDFAFSGTCLL